MGRPKRCKSGGNWRGMSYTRYENCYKGSDHNEILLIILRRNGIDAYDGVDSHDGPIFYRVCPDNPDINI